MLNKVSAESVASECLDIEYLQVCSETEVNVKPENNSK